MPGHGAHRLVDSYRGPIMRVRLGDGREFDVYDDDPATDVPYGDLRHGELEAAARVSGVVHLLHYYNQAPWPGP